MTRAQTFPDVIIDRVRATLTPCIVGIDPDVAKMPAEFLAELGPPDSTDTVTGAAAVERFSAEIIEAVHDLVPAVKPQAAYFERYGSAGLAALERTVELARRRGLSVILDAKRGDIGATAEAYAAAYLARLPPRSLECDALTVNPYLGFDSLEPFFEVCARDGKGVFVLVRTSNPGSKDLQDRVMGGGLLFEAVGELIAPRAATLVGRSGFSAIGAVVGGTEPHHARVIRKLLPHSIFLVPGFGAQGGDPSRVREYCDRDGLGALFSSSRAVIYPHLYSGARWSRGAIRQATLGFIKAIRSALGEDGR